MANFSTYKKLELPVSTEKYNVQVFNKNNQVIDSELHRLDLKNQSQDDLLATKEALNAESSRAKAVETALDSALSSHNTSALSHSDMRLLISDLTERLNALADSDDATLDQLSEIVAYIKSNKSLIDGVTTYKVNVSDIIDNLTTTVSNKPLSARQGNLLKGLIADLTAVVENKVDKISGKGLSTNDFTTEEKNKLNGIASDAKANVQSDWNVTDSTSDAFIKNKPDISSIANNITPASIGAVAKTGDKMIGSLTVKTNGSHAVNTPKIVTSDETNQRIFYGSESIVSVTPSDAVGILKLNSGGSRNNGRVVTESLLHVKGGISVDQGLESVGEDLREYRYIPVFNGFTADPGTGGIVRYAHRKNSGLAPYYHWTTSSNDAGYYYKITVGARDTDIGIVNWMISFNLTVYQSYRYCKFAISGYVYKASNSTPISWYEPRAEMVEGDSAIDNRFVYFGKDQSEHLYVAIDALMYAGITIDNINVSYDDIVLDYSTLFSLSKEPTLDNTTKYTQKLAYRPFYLDEANELKNSVSNGKAQVASAITAKGIYTAASATFETMANCITGINANLMHAYSTGLWWLNSGEVYTMNSTLSNQSNLSNIKIRFSLTVSASANAGKGDWSSAGNWICLNNTTYTVTITKVSDGTTVFAKNVGIADWDYIAAPYGIDALKGVVAKFNRIISISNASGSALKVNITASPETASYELVTLVADYYLGNGLNM